jgi:hypothetical protein
MAKTGAVVNHSGAWAKPLWATIRASGSRPFSSAAAALVMTRAAAPSEMEDELAAVTVPPSRRKAGRISGILSSSQRNGSSSLSTRVSVRRVRTRTGTISSSKSPFWVASRARRTEAVAKASWSSRVNW